MKYVTIAMLCKHTGKHRSTIVRGLRAAGITMEQMPGMKGGRLTEREANKFLLKHWPEIGAFPVEARS